MSEQATEPTVVDLTPEAPEKVKIQLSKVLEGIIQLIFAGSFPGTHAAMLFEAVSILQKLADAEKAKEAETESAHVE